MWQSLPNNMELNMELIGPLVALAVIVLLFLIFRAVMLWYWRINDIVGQLQGVNDKLERMLNKN